MFSFACLNACVDSVFVYNLLRSETLLKKPKLEGNMLVLAICEFHLYFHKTSSHKPVVSVIAFVPNEAIVKRKEGS